jgi:multiple sugar transport system permease protein
VTSVPSDVLTPTRSGAGLGVAVPRRRARSRARRAETRAFYICISPWIVGFILFTAGPIGYLLYLSLTNQHTPFTAGQYIGMENYRNALSDPTFRLAVENTVYYVAILVPATLCISLAIAVLLNRPMPGRTLFRTAFYIPVVTPLVGASVLWLWLLNPQYGILNQLLQAVGITGPGWLASPTWSKPGLIIMGIWASIGTQMIIYLAALQGVPKELLEAAQVDGASKWRVFWRITIPMISPAIFFNFVIGVIFSFQVFTPAFIMTSGGPLQSTTFWVFYIFQQAFAFFNLGYAAALSFLLLIFVLILTLLEFRYFRRFVHYER